MSVERPMSNARMDYGFTLLEVIVALLIAGFALAAMLGSVEAGLASGGRRIIVCGCFLWPGRSLTVRWPCRLFAPVRRLMTFHRIIIPL